METPTPTRIRVVVRAWGNTAEDTQKAIDAMNWNPSRYRWEIVDTQTSSGGACDISTDPAALAQGRNYGWAFAVYEAPADA